MNFSSISSSNHPGIPSGIFAGLSPGITLNIPKGISPGNPFRIAFENSSLLLTENLPAVYLEIRPVNP